MVFYIKEDKQCGKLKKKLESPCYGETIEENSCIEWRLSYCQVSQRLLIKKLLNYDNLN